MPTMIAGRDASFSSFNVSLIDAGSGPGSETGGAVIPPHAIDSFSTGLKSTSIGKSTKTGPGAPDVVALQARLTIRGISSTFVTRWQNLVIGLERTT